MISVGEALAQVCAATPVLGGERVALAAAVGRVAAEDVVAARAVPNAPNSAMDGYAVRHADVAAAPARLRVVAVEPAGTVTAVAVEPGTAVKLFTGSVIPPGADSVVRVEDTEEQEGMLVVRVSPARGAHIRGVGEDIRPGQVVVAPGTVLGPADVGVLASVGRATVVVHQRPRVVILSTGTELVEVDEEPGAGQVVNSNAYTLAAAAREAGADAVVLPIVRDRPEDIRARLEEAVRADVVLSSGGVSVGDLDYVKEALDAVHVERVFWKVAQKPGKPLMFGRREGRLFFGLPGAPPPAGAPPPPPAGGAGDARPPGTQVGRAHRVRARAPRGRTRRPGGDGGRIAELGRPHLPRQWRRPAGRAARRRRAARGAVLSRDRARRHDPGARSAAVLGA